MSTFTNLVIFIGHLPTIDIPNPQPTAPPGGNAIAGTFIGYGKWAAVIVGVLVTIGAGISLAAARRGHGEGQEHAKGFAQIAIGVGVALMAVGFVTVLVTGLGVE
jgi:predicted small integral membrane protein